MKRAKILSASAGSGKTYQLTYNYIREVLKEPHRYRAILAITFTNKATEEMKSRILREINILALHGNSPYIDDLCNELEINRDEIYRRALKAQTHILHDYSRFSVMTIDRFFQRILRAFIRELGIDLNYSIELNTKSLLRHSAENLIEYIATNEELREWMLKFTEEHIDNANKWDISEQLTSLGKQLFNNNERRLISMEQTKEELSQIINQYKAESSRLNDEIIERSQRVIRDSQAIGLDIEKFASKQRGFMGTIKKYSEGEVCAPTKNLINASSDINSWFTAANQKHTARISQELFDNVATICELALKLEKINSSNKALLTNYHSFALLADLHKQITLIYSDENIMTLDEAKNRLSQFIDGNNTPFIYEKVGNRYERFMIDEFQDTSTREWNNLLPLLENAMASSDEESVFIVGDVKQSIYRWRGGDWRLLSSKAISDLGAENVTISHLENNYRSLPKVVDFNNRLIGEVVKIDNQNLNSALYEAKSEGSIAQKTYDSHYNIISTAYAKHSQNPAKKTTREGYAQLHLFEDKNNSPFIEAIEGAIARGYKYSDILILVRAEKESREVCNALFKYKQEKFIAQGKTGFNILEASSLKISAGDIVQFIISVFRLAVNPKNGIERGIYNKYLKRPFHQMLNSDELESLKHISHLSPLEAFEYIVNLYNLHEHKADIAYLQALHDEVISFTANRISDLQHFLVWWDDKGCEQNIITEMDDNTIEVMTIHKSKGLERPIVIIPYCNWDIVTDSRLKPIVWAQAEGEDGLPDIKAFPVVLNKELGKSIFSNDYFEECVMMHIDAINLLYVAFTRAADELYIYAPSQYSANDITSLVARAAELICGEAKVILNEDGTPTINKIYSFGTQTSPEQKSKDSTERCTLLNEYTTHRPNIKIRYPRQRFGEEGMLPGSSMLKQGIRMHRIFEKANNEEDILRELNRIEQECLIDSNEAITLRAKITEAMQNPIVKDWFSNRWSDVRNEAEIITTNKEIRRPDKVLIDGRNAVVVDFKFGENTSPSYHKQVKEYMTLLHDMGRYDNIEGYIWYIARGEVVKVE